MNTHVIFCIMPIHGHCTLMYPGLLYVFAVMCRVVSFYSVDWMAGSSTGFFITLLLGGLIMYFGHCMTPMTSHIRGHLLQLILTHMVDHTFMAFSVPLQTLQTPWTIFLPLMFPISSLKTCKNCHTRILNPLLRIYVDFTLKPTYIGMCAKGQIFLEFSLMWIRVTCLLAFQMPRDHLDLTFHYTIEAL